MSEEKLLLVVLRSFQAPDAWVAGICPFAHAGFNIGTIHHGAVGADPCDKTGFVPLSEQDCHASATVNVDFVIGAFIDGAGKRQACAGKFLIAFLKREPR